MPPPVVTLLRTPGPAPRVLTIDAEDWFHVCGEDYYSDWRRWDSFPSRIETTLHRLFDLLEELKLPAAHNMSSLICTHRPDLVERMRARGDEIIGHGRTQSERQGAMWEEDEAQKTALQEAYLLAWESGYSTADVRRAWELASALYGFYHAVSYQYIAHGIEELVLPELNFAYYFLRQLLMGLDQLDIR